MINELIAFLKSQGLGSFEKGVIRLKSDKPEVFDNIKAVRNRIAEILPAEGWISYTDSVDVIGESDRVKADLDIVGAELTNGRSSLHVRQRGKGWTVVELVKENGDGVIVSDTFVGRADKNVTGKLRYETCWKVQDSPVTGGAKAYQPFVSRFIGFVKEEK